MRSLRGVDGQLRHVLGPAAEPAKRGRKARVVPDPIKTNGESSAEQLRLFLERLERLHQERHEIGDDIKDVLAEAVSTGFDRTTINAILRLRRMEQHHREEADVLLETYLVSLGMR